MAASRSVPRILQRPPAPPEREGASPGAHAPQGLHPPQVPHVPHIPGEGRQKGDLRTQVEAPKPSRDREVGDLESSERETHGRA